MNQHCLSRETIMPGILSQLNLYIELTHLIERAVNTHQPVLVAILKVFQTNSVDQETFIEKMKPTLINIGRMIKTRFNNGELIGFSYTTTEFSLAMEVNQSDLLQTIEQHVDDVVGYIMAEFPSKQDFRLSFSYALKIPDTTTFADNFIADARKYHNQIYNI